MKICYTVCTLNRLGQVAALAESLMQSNPDYRFFACLADELQGRIDPAVFPQIHFLTVRELDMENKQEFLDRYDSFELSCALKPYFGSHLLAVHRPDVVVYLDTDILVYSSLEPVEQALQNHSVVITPHFTQPIPADGKYPLERDVLNSGLYNGGFVAFRNDAAAAGFLSWWRERLFDQGYNNVCAGMMVDQLWLNLAPLYFPQVGVLMHPGCNLAYWNLHERRLSSTGDRYQVDGQPLVFFHFSGYRIDQPERLSIHQNRIDEAEQPALRRLLADYSALLNRFGFTRFLSLQPAYGRTKGEKKIPWPKKLLIRLLKRYGYALEKIRKV